MITAEAFAKRPSTWRNLTPSLEQYTRWANLHLLKFAKPLYSSHNSERSALISEAAFHALASDHDDIEPADQAAAHQSLSRLPGKPLGAPQLSAFELDEAKAILWRLEAFVRGRPDSVLVRPEFKGCGLVEPAVGDLLIGTDLVEVKSVARSLRSADFCQLLTYAAMDYAAGNRRIARLVILNPRAGHLFRADADELALDIGAASWVDLMELLVGEMAGPAVSV